MPLMKPISIPWPEFPDNLAQIPRVSLILSNYVLGENDCPRNDETLGRTITYH